MSITVTSNFDPKAEAKTVETGDAPSETAEATPTKEASEESSAAEGQDPEAETLEAQETSNEEKPEGEESEGESGKPEKKGNLEKKFQKLTQKRKLAEQERDYWREQALKGQKPQAEEKPPVQAKPESKGEPDPEKFTSHADYMRALARWEIQQERAKEAQENQKAQIQEEVQELNKAHKARVEEFAKTTPDFNEVLESADIGVTDAVTVAIVESDQSAKILYYLAKNEAEAERLNGLEGAALYREIGKLEGKLSESGSKSAEMKLKSNASKPITPVKPGSATAKKSIFEAKTQAEYEALRMEQMASRKSAWG